MRKVIGILAGSLRKESFSKKIARVITSMAPKGFEFNIIPLDDLPVYNPDFDDENRVPESYVAFRNAVKAVDGVIFITPEYNRSVPGVLKNALDIGSRPMGSSVWSGKPAAVFSNSPGNLSAFGANHHLRQSLVFLNMPTMQQPEVYLAQVKELFDESENLKSEETEDFLQKAVNAYIDWFMKVI
ncbi:MAG: NAD(P)H-dependent oxidoreductase [Parapedobacter sp.]|nr:MAG: NAD(P)H-dependent oxidoreductase [Parapedobacter sp.]